MVLQILFSYQNPNIARFIRVGCRIEMEQRVTTALKQIKDKRYPESILNYTGDILLVGINYNKGTKEHQCLIEKYEKD